MVSVYCWLEVEVGAVNLDFNVPLVKTSPGNAVTDRFGYSVTLHHVAVPAAGNFDSFITNAR